MQSKILTNPVRHSFFEDSLAIFTGTLFVSVGLVLFKQAGLLSGGTAGTAFLLHYASGYTLGVIYFVINIPFYWFAWKHMGKEFTVKTFVSVALLSYLTEATPQIFLIEKMSAGYISIVGGLLLGSGSLFLARHKASLGGVAIAALYLQRHRGWRAGKVQLVVDVTVLLLAFAVIPREQVMFSILAAFAMNVFIALNHRPGRYVGV